MSELTESKAEGKGRKWCRKQNWRRRIANVNENAKRVRRTEAGKAPQSTREKSRVRHKTPRSRSIVNSQQARVQALHIVTVQPWPPIFVNSSPKFQSAIITVVRCFVWTLADYSDDNREYGDNNNNKNMRTRGANPTYVQTYDGLSQLNTAYWC